MPKFNVGDTVIRRDRRGSYEDTITRVGRKYAYIKRFGREVPFDIETGVEKSDYGAPDRIYTPTEWAAREHRQGMETRLTELGVKFDYGSRWLSNDALEKFIAIIETDTRE